MSRLPVIVGLGGYNAAGRSYSHHVFRRMVIESLDEHSRQETLAGLAVMTRRISASAEGFVSHEGENLSLADIEARHDDELLVCLAPCALSLVRIKRDSKDNE